MTNEKTKQQINRIKGQFAVNPDYSAERTGNYELRNKIASKWANINGGVEHLLFGLQVDDGMKAD